MAFTSLYAREAHPGDRYPQTHDFDQKLQHARDYRDRDSIPWPVVVDDLDTLHRQLDPRLHAAYVMAPNGTVADRPTPFVAGQRVLSYLCAVNEFADITGDGTPLDRPDTKWAHAGSNASARREGDGPWAPTSDGHGEATTPAISDDTSHPCESRGRVARAQPGKMRGGAAVTSRSTAKIDPDSGWCPSSSRVSFSRALPM